MSMSGGNPGFSGATSGGCPGSPSSFPGTEGSPCCTDGDCYFYPVWCALPAACIDGVCGPCIGGPTGSVATGGAPSVLDSGISNSHVAIEFAVTGQTSYCGGICGGPEIQIANEGGTTLAVEPGCDAADCRTCVPRFNCIEGPRVGVAVTGATFDWDGTVYSSSTCGAGSMCDAAERAPPGRYTATFCATPGTLVGPDGSIPECNQTGSTRCASVTFDFPKDALVQGTLGP
jgi:hypothetical protein